MSRTRAGMPGEYNYNYVASAGADNVISASPAYLHAIIVGAAVGSSVIEVSDHASDGDGNVQVYLAGDTIGPAVYPIELEFGTGITADLTNQTNVTFVYR